VLLLVVFAVLSTSCAVQVTSLARHVTRPPRHSPAHATLIDDDLVATLKRRNVTVISTLAREEAMSARADDPVYVDRPFFKRGLSAERPVLLKTAKRDEQRNAPKQALLRRAFEIDRSNLKKLEGRIPPPQMPARGGASRPMQQSA
jgi:hypothetical protein